MKAYGGVVIWIHIFLTSALVEGEWSVSRSGHFTPGEGIRGIHWIGGWVGSRAGLNDVENRKFLTLSGLELRPFGRPARSQSLVDYAIAAKLERENVVLNSCNTLQNLFIFWTRNCIWVSVQVA
jgi:hypothetical protein